MKLLLVEDDPEVCMRIRKYLMQRRFGCDVAINSEEALEMLLTNDYFLILLDMTLPDRSVFDTARIIRDYRINTKILALRDYGTPLKYKDCLKAGITGYIYKPVSRERFNTRINQVCKFHEWMPPPLSLNK